MRLVKILFVLCVVLLLAGVALSRTGALGMLNADGTHPVPIPWEVADGTHPVPIPWQIADGTHPVPIPWHGVAA